MSKYFTKAYWQENDIELMIGHMLRIGVFIAASVSIIGGLMYLIQYGTNPRPEHNVFVGERFEFRNVAAVLRGVVVLDSLSIMQFGVLLLIATPIARIVFSFFVFLLERDMMYVVMTLLVLAIIGFSMFSGISG